MKQCETCEFWAKVFLNDDVAVMEPFIEYLKTLEAVKDKITETEYGECKKAAERFFLKNHDIIDNLKEGKVQMFIEVDEQCVAKLCTHKDHCCKCWREKEVEK